MRKTRHRTRFNPHAHVGRDFDVLEQVGLERVSIHTPMWGVTDSLVKLSLRSSVSIHTPTWGVTDGVFWRSEGDLFQSTRPRGA